MKTKFLSVLAVTAILIASCGNDNEVTPEVNDGRIQFTSGVNAAPSRVGGADGDQWTQNDLIGIYMRDNTVGKAIVSDNIEYKATSFTNSNKSASFTSITPIYYPVNTPAKVDFVAYYPYQSGISNYVYKVDVSSTRQASQSSIDLMRAYADGIGNAGYDKTNTLPVNLVFDHQLAKVALNVTAGAGVTDLSGLTIAIKGMNTTADFNIASTVLSNEDGASTSSITPYHAGSYSYEAILLPVAALGAAHIVEFTIGSNTYTWTMSNNSSGITSLVAGNKYIFDVTLQKNAIAVSGTIAAWGNGGIDSGTAN